MKDRVVLLIKALNYTAAQFADEIGVQKSGISHIISGRNNPSLDFIQKILQRFPEVNMEWLIQGKGPMIKGEQMKKPPMESTLFSFAESDSPGPDLFSQEISHSGSVKETVVPEQNIDESTAAVKPLIIPARTSQEVKEKDPSESNEQSLGSAKKLEKIVFFFTDRTFQEYFPGN